MAGLTRVAPATASAPASARADASHPHARLRQSLAGMTYQEQLDAVRPPLPLQRAVQRTEDEESGSAPLPALVPVVAVIGQPAWDEIQALHASGAGDYAVIVALLGALQPQLFHAGDRRVNGEWVVVLPGEQEDPDSPTSRWGTDCQYTTRLLLAALAELGVPAVPRAYDRHATTFFPTIQLGMYHADDLYVPDPPATDVAQVERLLLTEEQLKEWSLAMRHGPRAVREELRAELDTDAIDEEQEQEVVRVLEMVRESGETIRVPIMAEGQELPDFVEVPLSEVLLLMRTRVLADRSPEGLLQEIRYTQGDVLNRLDNWLGNTGDPAIQGALAEYLPNGRLPANRAEALMLAVHVITERVLVRRSASEFHGRMVHPAYR